MYWCNARRRVQEPNFFIRMWKYKLLEQNRTAYFIIKLKSLQRNRIKFIAVNW